MKHTILSSHFCLFQNSLIDLLTSKGSCFITKNIKCCFAKKRKKGFWTTNPFFSGLRMYFYRLWYLIWSDGCLLYCKHISLDFNCIIDFSSFHNRLKHLCNLKLVSILRGSGRYSWHVKLLFFHFLGSFSQNVPKLYPNYQVSNIQSI